MMALTAIQANTFIPHDCGLARCPQSKPYDSLFQGKKLNYFTVASNDNHIISVLYIEKPMRENARGILT